MSTPPQAPPSSPETSSGPVPFGLDVLSLNVWGLPWPISRARRARFDRILRHLDTSTHHLVGLQELWGRTHRLLRELSPLRQASGGDSGLALAGDLRPRLAPRVHAFSRGSGPDRLKSKGVLEALVQLPGGQELRVLVTHLQAGLRHASVRAHQVDELLTAAAATDLPTILMGDFNLYGDSREDHSSGSRLHAEGFADAALQAGDAAPTYASCNPFVGRAVAERFDRVFIRSSSELKLTSIRTEVLAPELPLSDHHPLYAQLLVTPLSTR